MLTMRSLLRTAGCAVLVTCCFVTVQAEDDPFAKWEQAIAKFEMADETEPPPEDAVLFVGSSSIRLWDLEKSFPGRDVINRGFGGSQIADSIHFADRIILKYRPRVIILYAGDNDIAKGKSAEVVFKDFQTFIKTVRAELPNTTIGFIAVKPSLKRWNLVEEIRSANQKIADFCDEHDRLVYLDIFTPMIGEDGKPRQELFVDDGLHLNDAGYKLWTSVLSPLVSGDDDPTPAANSNSNSSESMP